MQESVKSISSIKLPWWHFVNCLCDCGSTVCLLVLSAYHLVILADNRNGFVLLNSVTNLHN